MTRATASSRARRPGFTLLECLAAFAGLAVAGVLAAQVGAFVVAERFRLDARFEAEAAAENAMEAARAAEWADLTPAWAAKQRLPEYVRLPDGKLAVTVADEPDRPGVRRVTVAVTWTDPGGRPARPVALTALFASRSRGEP